MGFEGLWGARSRVLGFRVEGWGLNGSASFGLDFCRRKGRIGWFLVGNEGMRALYTPFKGLYRALIPSFPTKNQGEVARGLMVCFSLFGFLRLSFCHHRCSRG